MTDPKPKRQRGCLFYLVIAAVVLLLFILVALFVGAQVARRMLNEFTDAQPLSLPVSSLPAAQADEARTRVRTFEQAVSAERTTPVLELSSDQINALVATEPQFQAFRGKVFVTLEGSEVKGMVSVPMEQLGMPMFKGRYLNADVTLAVSFRNGSLQILPETVLVKGKPLPSVYMEKLRRQNFGQDVAQNPRWSMALERLQSIEVKDSKLIIIPKAP